MRHCRHWRSHRALWNLSSSTVRDVNLTYGFQKTVLHFEFFSFVNRYPEFVRFAIFTGKYTQLWWIRLRQLAAELNSAASTGGCIKCLPFTGHNVNAVDWSSKFIIFHIFLDVLICVSVYIKFYFLSVIFIHFNFLWYFLWILWSDSNKDDDDYYHLGHFSFSANDILTTTRK